MNDFGVLTNRKRAVIALIHSIVFLGIAFRGFVSLKAGVLHGSGTAGDVILIAIYLIVASILVWLVSISRGLVEMPAEIEPMKTTVRDIMTTDVTSCSLDDDLGDRGRVLLAGGRLTQDRLTDRMWWFDPATRRFTPAGRLPTPLADSAVAAAGGSPPLAYLVGGESPSVTDRVVRLALR